VLPWLGIGDTCWWQSGPVALCGSITFEYEIGCSPLGIFYFSRKNMLEMVLIVLMLATRFPKMSEAISYYFVCLFFSLDWLTVP
jgi:hypothetical protein